MVFSIVRVHFTISATALAHSSFTNHFVYLFFSQHAKEIETDWDIKSLDQSPLFGAFYYLSADYAVGHVCTAQSCHYGRSHECGRLQVHGCSGPVLLCLLLHFLDE